MDIPLEILNEIRLHCDFPEALAFQLLSKTNFNWKEYFHNCTRDNLMVNPKQLVLFLKNNDYVDIVIKKIKFSDFLKLVYYSILDKNYKLFFRIIDLSNHFIIESWNREQLFSDCYKIAIREAPYSVLRVLFEINGNKNNFFIVIEQIIILERYDILEMIHKYINVYDSDPIIANTMTGYLQSRNIDITLELFKIFDVPIDDIVLFCNKLFQMGQINQTEHEILTKF